jgi:hypothetical protein
MKKNIGIVILATHSYFVLGIRLIKRFMHFYKGGYDITFYFFSDADPKDYLPDNIDVIYFPTYNKDWCEGTNLKFISILSIEKNGVCKSDYLLYLDADTNVERDFTEEWFLGDMIGGQHYGDQTWMKKDKGFERNSISKAYVPVDTKLPQMYYFGAFFGGTKDNMMAFCKRLRQNQLADKVLRFEPGGHDEAYINQYFHFNPPSKVVLYKDFAFSISNKGGINDMRNMSNNVDHILKKLLTLKDSLIDIHSNEVFQQ